MSKTTKKGPASKTTATAPPAAMSTADAYLAFGTGKTDAQMVRKSNLWRDNYNPLRGLVMGRLITIFEAAERGAYAELQLLLRKTEKRYPILKGFIERLLASVEELNWDVKVLKVLPPGATAEMAEKQRAFLRSRYDLIGNINEAIGQIVMADIRGYAILQKHRYSGGDNDGAVAELYWLEPWAWARDGYYGDFYYNEISRFGVGLGSCVATFGEPNRIGSEALPREEFVIREVESPLYEIALIAFVNWLMGRKDWAAFVEIFGLAKGVVIMPPNIAVGKEPDYQAAAEKVSDGVSGALPAGSDIKFPTAGVRGESPFEKFCNAQNEDVVMAATSGLLTMLTHGGGGTGGGLNKGPGKEHSEVWEKIAKMKGKRVNETLRQDFDAPELAAEFPGQPVCAQFTLAVQDDEDVNTVADTVVKFEGVGLQTDAKEISERSGYKLVRVAPPNGGAGPAKQDESLVNKDTKIQNRAARLADGADAFTSAVADDLKILRDRVTAIEAISDPELRKQKLSALLDGWDQLIADITADPESARVLEEINANALLAGLKNQPVKNRGEKVLNFGQEQPRDSLGRWVDENGGGLPQKENIARGKKAMARSIRQKADVQKAMYRKGVGQIDFPHGTPGDKDNDYAGGHGVSHIVAKHGEDTAHALPEVLAKGKISTNPRDPETKRLITHGNYEAALVKENTRKAWLLTGFRKQVGG